MKKEDKQRLYNMYNATSTDDGNGDIETYENWLERQLLSRIDKYEDLDLFNANVSWLDHHVLNENSEIDGVIIKHHHAPETYGGVCIKTIVGNFAIIKEDQEKAAKNKGATVRVKPHKEYYGTVMILQYK